MKSMNYSSSMVRVTKSPVTICSVSFESFDYSGACSFIIFLILIAVFIWQKIFLRNLLF